MTRIGGPRGLDLGALGDIQELEEMINGQAAADTGVGNQGGTPQIQVPNIAQQGGLDRGGAQGVLASRSGQVNMGNIPPTDGELKQQITELLQKMGYLPAGKPTEQQLQQASQKFVGEHMRDMGGGGDIDELFSKIEALVNRQNQRQAPPARTWSGGSNPNRSPMLPSASTSQSRGSGPAPNQGSLQNQATQAINQNPPPPGSINERVANAARNYLGTSTAAGPDGGNLACAWSVNNILSNAGLQKVGSNPNYVPSVEQALNGGRGTRIDPSQMRPGDIVIWPNGHHIGIATGNNQVANNSSSRANFSNLSALPAGARVYRLNS